MGFTFLCDAQATDKLAQEISKNDESDDNSLNIDRALAIVDLTSVFKNVRNAVGAESSSVFFFFICNAVLL